MGRLDRNRAGGSRARDVETADARSKCKDSVFCVQSVSRGTSKGYVHIALPVVDCHPVPVNNPAQDRYRFPGSRRKGLVYGFEPEGES